MTQLFANNAYSSLAANASNSTTTLTLATGTGARFPSPTGGNYFLLTLVGLDGNANESSWEIVKVTARSTDTLTVVRAQESTTAVAWSTGTRVESRATAGTFSGLESTANKGAANGYAPLGSDSKVAAIYLPSYVDDVLEYANLAAFPATGENGKIYVTLDTNKTYRWSGSVYVEISPAPGTSDAVPEGSTNLYFTNARAQAALSGMYLPIGGGTLTGPVTFAASQKFPEQVGASIRPSLLLDFANSKTLDPRITFTRASAATYTGADGLIKTAASGEARFDFNPTTGESLGLLIEEARTNLLTYSEQFDNAIWTKLNTTVTANATTAPDGTTTADKVVESAANDFHNIHQNVSKASSPIAYAFSVSLKAGERSFTSVIMTDAGGYVQAGVNLTTGVAQLIGFSGFTTPSVYIVGLSNGWFRVTLVATSTAGTSVNTMIRPALSISADSYTGDGTSGIYIWGAQLEMGAFPTGYIPSNDTFTSRASSGSFIGSNGLIQSAATNVARYNYNPLNLVIPPKLLLEPAATNLLVYSEQFDNVLWTKNNITVTANAVTAPDGTTTADRLIESIDSTAQYHETMQYVTGANTYTLSFFAKADSKSKIALDIYNPTDGSVAAYIDLSTGTISSTTSGATSSIIPVGNGWYRCTMTKVITYTSTTRFGIFICDNSNSVNYIGSGKGIYIWGAQLETGTSATSYIPTVASQVTRAADVSSSAQTTRAADNAVMTGTNFSSWYRQDEGSFLAKSDFIGVSSVSQAVFSASDASGNRHIFYRTTGKNRTYQIDNSGIQAALSGQVLENGVMFCGAAAYKVNDISVSFDGVTPLTDTSSTIPSPNRLDIGDYAGLRTLNGHIAKLAYYPKRLSNAELQSITTV